MARVMIAAVMSLALSGFVVAQAPQEVAPMATQSHPVLIYLNIPGQPAKWELIFDGHECDQSSELRSLKSEFWRFGDVDTDYCHGVRMSYMGKIDFEQFEKIVQKNAVYDHDKIVKFDSPNYGYSVKSLGAYLGTRSEIRSHLKIYTIGAGGAEVNQLGNAGPNWAAISEIAGTYASQYEHGSRRGIAAGSTISSNYIFGDLFTTTRSVSTLRCKPLKAGNYSCSYRLTLNNEAMNPLFQLLTLGAPQTSSVDRTDVFTWKEGFGWRSATLEAATRLAAIKAANAAKAQNEQSASTNAQLNKWQKESYERTQETNARCRQVAFEVGTGQFPSTYC